MALILASASPRRRELMALVYPDYLIETSDVAEEDIFADSPSRLAQSLAIAKARSVAQKHPRDTVIGFDTVVDCAGAVFGKPRDQAEALQMLHALSGRAHRVHTGICVCQGGRAAVTVETTTVYFAPIPEAELLAYVETPEPYDKAGGYAIQGRAARWCSRIEGCYYNIMGLPVHRAVQLLGRFGVR